MRLSFDIECNGLNEVTKGKEYVKEADKILCISLYDIDTKQSFLFFDNNISKGIDMLRKASLIIGHNIFAYDIPLIERFYGPLNKKPYTEVFDTILVSRLMWPEKMTCPLPNGSHSLKAWGLYLREEKTEYVGTWDTYNYNMGKYCVQDSVVGAAIYAHQVYLPFLKQYEHAVKLEHEVSDIIRKQVETGFSFSVVEARNLEANLMVEKSIIEDNMRRVFPDITTKRFSIKTGKELKENIEVFNPGSRQQIASRLTEKYGWVPPETEKGNPQVSEEVLLSLSYPESAILCDYFSKVKLMSQVSDWIQRAAISRDNKVHGSINTLGAVTGRMTSKEPNMQQVTKDSRVRSLFLPSKGRVLVGADLKGLELRMLAHYLHNKDKGIYSSVVCQGDIHDHNKKAMLLDDREVAKTAIYCFLYGGGDEKFAKTINTTTGNARKIKNNLLTNIPGLKLLIQECKDQSNSDGSVYPFSFRPIPVRKEHAALNTLLQSSGAIVSKVWLTLANKSLIEKFKESEFSWVANVHDEVQVECNKDIAKEVGAIILKAAIDAGLFLKCLCPIEANFRIGNTWAETH